jgi:hypothetical protein
MLALLLNHSPMFVAGDGARPVAGLVRRRFNRCSRSERLRSLREAGHPNATIVRRSAGEVVPARPNAPCSAQQRGQ